MKFFKKSLAILTVIAMVFSLVTVNVLAADEDVTVIVRPEKTSMKLGGPATVNVYIAVKEDITLSMPGFTLVCDATKIAEGITNTMENSPLDVKVSTKNVNEVKFGKQGSLDVKTGENLVATLSLPLLDTVVVADEITFTLKGINFMDADGAGLSVAQDLGKITIIDGFTATQAVVEPATLTAGLGDTAEDIIAKLPTTATVKNEAGDKSEGGWAITDWACADYDADTAKDYTFKGKVMPDESKAGVVAEGGLEVTVTVTVGKIALDASMVEALEDVSVKAVKEDAEKTSMTAAEALAAVTDQLVTKVAIANNGKYEEEATVAWAVKADATLDLTKVTAEEDNEANVVTLVGTVTPAEGGNYTGTAAVEINVVVAPAVVTGGSVKLPSANQSGKPKVTITFPTETVGEGEEAVTSVVGVEAGQEVVAEIIDEDGEVAGTVTATLTEDDIEAGGLTVQFTESLKTMGFTSGDEYTVIVKIDGAEFLNGDAAEGEGTTTTVKYTGSGGVSGIGNTATTTKEYAVKVADAANGTVAVSKTAAVKGTVITVTATPAEGYKVDTITVKDNNGINIPVDQDAKTFEMPAKEVTVTVTFVEGEEEVVTPPVADGSFTDVPADHWAAASIDALVAAGIINGNADGSFAPDQNITRAEFTKMIVNLFGVEATSTETGFVDCAADAWFTPYIAAAKEAGYVTGVSETEFAPNDYITREEACAILGRALNASTDAAVTFTDAADIEAYAVGYVAALAELGLVNGYEDGSFAPAKSITRAEAAKIVAGALELVSKIEEAAAEEVVEEATEEAAGEATEEAAEEATEEVTEETTEEAAEETAEEAVEEETTEEAAE